MCDAIGKKNIINRIQNDLLRYTEHLQIDCLVAHLILHIKQVRSSYESINIFRGRAAGIPWGLDSRMIPTPSD